MTGERECRLKRVKLVAGRARLTSDCIVEELSLWGEFMADPSLDELLGALRGRGAREALRELREQLPRLYAEPLEDILACLEELLDCSRRGEG